MIYPHNEAADLGKGTYSASKPSIELNKPTKIIMYLCLSPIVKVSPSFVLVITCPLRQPIVKVSPSFVLVRAGDHLSAMAAHRHSTVMKTQSLASPQKYVLTVLIVVQLRQITLTA
ncbi:hypothetical protein GN244_ATG08783 [Phytophthora infestans]|uniref:Uncharacterized protein n=1 Tax=Phytophthora infestans TaxID=4787 RepID=A0A833WVF5_PHYIN|nr:hypothetical protein GN244_ATG08783 [Phytophthora infestans]